MSTRITISDLERLKKEGKIRGYVDTSKVKSSKIKVQKGSKIKGWIELNLHYWCQGKGLTLLKEHRFDEVRKWRFDFAIKEKELQVAIEYNGIMSDKSRHTTVSGYTGDMDKINAASSQGWTILQYTPLNYKNIIRDLEKLIN